MPTVPGIYQGLWRRRVLETPAGVDRDTVVYWLQTGSLYADVRVPAGRRRRLRLRPGPPAAGELRLRARQQGFAGALDVNGDALEWRRWLDFQPPGAPDIGRVRFENGLLVEQGVHAAYREEWERLCMPGNDRLALSLEIEDPGDGHMVERAGVLVAINGYFMLAIARPAALPAARDLAELVEDEGYSLDARRGFLDCAIEFGLRHAGGRWEVRLSTLPHHEGLGFDRLHGRWRADGAEHYEQFDVGGVRRRWRVVERGPAFSGIGDAV